MSKSNNTDLRNRSPKLQYDSHQLKVKAFGKTFEIHAVGQSRIPGDFRNQLTHDRYQIDIIEDTDTDFVMSYTIPKEYEIINQRSIAVFITSKDLDAFVIGANIYSMEKFEIHLKNESADIRSVALVPWHHNKKSLLSATELRDEYLAKYGKFVPNRVEKVLEDNGFKNSR